MRDYKRLPEISLGETVKGTITVDYKVDVTDPCYDDDVWCRINNIELSAGEYECAYHILDMPYTCIDDDNTEKKFHDNRVSASMIRLAGVDYSTLDWEYIGEAGVDAGCCGFFPNKPNYGQDAWERMCNLMAGENHDWQEHAWITEDGFWTSSGLGDGGYPVFVGTNDKGENCAVAILFLADPYGIDTDDGWDEEDDDN